MPAPRACRGHREAKRGGDPLSRLVGYCGKASCTLGNATAASEKRCRGSGRSGAAGYDPEQTSTRSWL
jgi:hypothetical protein